MWKKTVSLREQQFAQLHKRVEPTKEMSSNSGDFSSDSEHSKSSYESSSEDSDRFSPRRFSNFDSQALEASTGSDSDDSGWNEYVVGLKKSPSVASIVSNTTAARTSVLSPLRPVIESRGTRFHDYCPWDAHKFRNYERVCPMCSSPRSLGGVDVATRPELDLAQARQRPRPRWRKILWERQPYADNYVDGSFMTGLVQNASIRHYDYYTLVRESAAISLEFSSTCLFGLVFIFTHRHVISLVGLIMISVLVIVIGYAVRTKVDPSFRWNAIIRSLKTVLLLYSAVFALSPMLRTLTDAFSNDTIWALSSIAFVVHVASFNYGALSPSINNNNSTNQKQLKSTNNSINNNSNNNNMHSGDGSHSIGAYKHNKTQSSGSNNGSTRLNKSNSTETNNISINNSNNNNNNNNTMSHSTTSAFEGSESSDLPLTTSNDSFRVRVQTSAVSLNAAIFASVLLGSRLPSFLHAFGLISLAIEMFGLYPIMRLHVRSRSPDGFVVLSWLSNLLVVVLLYFLNVLLAVFWLVSFLFITFLCPWWLIWLQRYKNEISGPWDEAIPYASAIASFGAR